MASLKTSYTLHSYINYCIFLAPINDNVNRLVIHMSGFPRIKSTSDKEKRILCIEINWVV